MSHASPTAGPSPPASSPHGRLDDAAFAAVFRDCAADVHGYAISLLDDRSGAEDVTALAFERLYRSRARLDRGRGTPRAWLFAIARNAALDELRRRGRQPEAEFDEAALPELAVGDDRSEGMEQVERREAVRNALAKLAPREREVVLLKFHGQLTNVELARALGISESNAGTRLHRALEHLRQSGLGPEQRSAA